MSSEKGQTLIELVIVITVIALIIGALVFATIASLRNSQFSKNESQATKLAQEGIERVRVGRDRNQCISNLDNTVKSWAGSSSNTNCSGAGSIWDFHISGLGVCEDLSNKCYFNVNTQGELNSIGFAQPAVPEAAETIASSGQGKFTRVILISDNLDHDNEFSDDDWTHLKEVTSLVTWRDYAGEHESKVTVVLRKL